MEIHKRLDRTEKRLDALLTPVKSYLPVIGRFLLVSTFLEDSLRMVTQWDDQIYYLSHHRGFYESLATLFLIFNILCMTVGSVLAIAKRYTEAVVGALFCVVVSQSVAYGLLFDTHFLFRSMSVAGGLMMLLADAYSSQKKSFSVFAGLPSINETDKQTYLQLVGRILLVFLFISFVTAGEMTLLRGIVVCIALVGAILVAVGFKAKWSALFLITFLSISNVVLNNWWALHHLHPERDFQKYDFFQTLSIMGGLLLLVNLGPGGFSVDENKKAY